MTGRRPTHLERRDGVYYFRAQLPRSAQERLSRREVRVSLRTRDYRAACHAAEIGRSEFRRLCARLVDMTELTDAQLEEALRAFGRDLVASAGWPGPFGGTDQWADRREIRGYVEDEIVDLTYALEEDSFDTDDGDRLLGASNIVAAGIKAFEERTSILVDALDPGRQQFVKEGLARAAIAVRQQFLQRLDDRFAAFSTSDPLFNEAMPRTAVPAHNGKTGPAFQAAIDKYVAAKTGVAWTSRTEEETKRVLDLAAEFFGPMTPVAQITKADIREFRDCILTWGKKPRTGASLADIRDAPKGKRIAAKTAAKYFGCVTAAFAFWAAEGYIDATPAQNLRVQTPKNQKLTEREPFSDADLKVLFSSPLFTSCAGKLRRMTPGDEVLRDGFYWIPLIGALSGMRVTEIVQLTLADAVTDGEVPIFKVRGDKAHGQSVKSEAGLRDVPIHCRLLELGFGEFVDARKSDASGGRLFSDVTLAETGGGGGEFSKWFGRQTRKIGLYRPGLVFHSFRHRFIDALRENSEPSYVIKTIVGHEGGDVTSGYGTAVSLKVRQTAIDRVSYLDALPPTK